MYQESALGHWGKHPEGFDNGYIGRYPKSKHLAVKSPPYLQIAARCAATLILLGNTCGQGDQVVSRGARGRVGSRGGRGQVGSAGGRSHDFYRGRRGRVGSCVGSRVGAGRVGSRGRRGRDIYSGGRGQDVSIGGRARDVPIGRTGRDVASGERSVSCFSIGLVANAPRYLAWRTLEFRDTK